MSEECEENEHELYVSYSDTEMFSGWRAEGGKPWVHTHVTVGCENCDFEVSGDWSWLVGANAHYEIIDEVSE